MRPTKPIIIKPVFDEKLTLVAIELCQGLESIVVSLENIIMNDNGYKWDGVVERVNEFREIYARGMGIKE